MSDRCDDYMNREYELCFSVRPRTSKAGHVTRGHNTVADGWAGNSNPHPQTFTKSARNACFSTFRLDHHGPTDGRIDQWTGGWIDKARGYYVVADGLFSDIQHPPFFTYI